jgi:hypothetical protein
MKGRTASLAEARAERKPRDLAAELAQESRDFPESWKPRPGDIIVGVVAKYTQAESKFGTRWICVLNVLNDLGVEYFVSIWLSHAVLLGEFAKLRPRVGERVGIKRLEDKVGSGGSYARYVVKVDRPEAESAPDWDKIAESALESATVATGASDKAADDDHDDIPF